VADASEARHYPLAPRGPRPSPPVYEPRHMAMGRAYAHGGSRLTLDMSAPAVPATVHVVHTHIIHVEQASRALALPSPRHTWLGRLGHGATMLISPALAVAATLWFTSGRTEVHDTTRIIERAVPILKDHGPLNYSVAPAGQLGGGAPTRLAAAGAATASSAAVAADPDDTNPDRQVAEKAAPAPKAMPLESMPAVVSATSKAIRTGVAQPWEGMGMSGYAVAGPVRLNGQQTCRRIAIWVDGQGPGANALGSDRCLASDGSWTAPPAGQGAAAPQSGFSASSATAAQRP
jgi:hypothetical protein